MNDEYRAWQDTIFMSRIAEALHTFGPPKTEESVPDRGTVIAGSRQILANLRAMAA